MNNNNKKIVIYYIGMCLTFGLFVYSIYNIITFDPIYTLSCEDEYNNYSIVTYNKTLFENKVLQCQEYKEKLWLLKNPQFIIPDLNFSLSLNNT